MTGQQSAPKKRCAGWLASIVILLVAPSLPLTTGEAAGQDGRERLDATEELLRRPTEISPRSGPPGTQVTVRGIHLPAITPVNVGFGGTRSGFEGLSFVLTDRQGVMEDVVAVPRWAERDRIHRFIIFDAYFEPLSMTPLFHVTDAEGRIFREGRVTDPGPACAVVTGIDRDSYRLVGRTDGLELDGQVTFEAVVVDSTECGDDTHVQIVTLTVQN